MSEKTIRVKKEENRLLVYYSPSINFDEIVRNIAYGTLIKGTFWVTQDNLIEVNEEEEYICFRIAGTEGAYYVLDKKVFNIENSIYVDKCLDITDKWFITYPHNSIMRRLDNLISKKLYIVESDDGIENHLPGSAFLGLVEIFPNAYEVNKYVNARIAYLLSNYVEGVWKHKESYEKYLEKKETHFSLVDNQCIKLMGYEMYRKAFENLERMLADPEPYSEKVWQEKIYEIICVLYPKYIASFREIEIGNDGRHSKKPDFILVDSSGFVDLLEIKKPNNQKVVSSTEYRNNYVAGRDLEGAIVQIEKYVYILNHEGEARAKKIRDKIAGGLPAGLEIKVVNPQGILLLGRSRGLTKEQLFDFEIIKRQHKNIVDIMTYDDLLNRLKNILKQMEADSNCI